MSRSLKPPTYQGSSRHGACQWDSFCARPARFRAHEGGGCGPGAVSSTSNAESILRYFPYAAPFTKSLGFVPNRLSRVSIIAMPFKFTRVLLVSIKLDMSGESGSSSYGVSLTLTVPYLMADRQSTSTIIFFTVRIANRVLRPIKVSCGEAQQFPPY